MSNPYEQIQHLESQNWKNNINSTSKVAVLFVNSYVNTSFTLGEDTCNDGILCYENFTKLGYLVFVYFDISGLIFKSLFRKFLSTKCEKLVIYFTGHGTQVRDYSHDEEDGRDEALVFKDGFISDDELSLMLRIYNRNSDVVLIPDCCHSGTIFDVKSDNKHVTTFSAAFDSQTAKQGQICHKGNGVFTYYLWKYWPNSDNNLYKLRDLINKKIKAYDQTCNCNHDLESVF